MAFVFIGGPMKSGKTLELIARVAPFEFADKRIVFVQPKKNVRETNITSRLGVHTKALVVASLGDVSGFDVVGVDEIHMFPEGDAGVIESWVREGKDVFISGLDLDYRGTMPPIVKNILELKPDTVISKQAVCEVCRTYDAHFTQILKEGGPVLGGLPLITPDDGTYAYEARCRKCFVKA